MKLSNFEWTDKETVKWFVMLPSGHEGPYSFRSLRERCERKSIGADTKIWAEGLSDTITIKSAIAKMEAIVAEEKKRAALKKVEAVVETPPAPAPVPEPEPEPEPVPEPVPEIKVEKLVVPSSKVIEEFYPPPPVFAAPAPSYEEDEEDDIPPLPPLPEEEVSEVKIKARQNFPVGLVAGVALIIMVYLFYAQWIRGKETISLRRYPKMSLDLFEKIKANTQFDGWGKQIFFKEYVPSDLSSIWFINSGFQKCDVEATFHSIKGKLLSVKDVEVLFQSRTMLKGHVAEFSHFEFTQGQKIIPGLYEVDINASNCEWDGMTPKLANKFVGPEESYKARTKVILFPEGAVQFNQLLEKLLNKKALTEIRLEKKDELFWQDMEEKLQTLQAISMQIEQFFLELLDKDAKKFAANLKEGINLYTRQFGTNLTSFVMSNEKDFQKLSSEVKLRVSKDYDYEKVIRLTGKEIGAVSIKIIDDLQKLKAPKRAQLNEEKKKVEESFNKLDQNITLKLEQIQQQKAK